MSKSLREEGVVRLWQQFSTMGEFVTEDGEPVQIVYPGRLSGSRGADFRDAIISTRQGLIKGDIEVHVKSSGWRGHGHHLDPAYGRVVLHVVMRDDSRLATPPTLVLEKLTRGMPPPDPAPPGCCRAGERFDTDYITSFLDSAGKARFLAKAARFEADLSHTEAGEVLYLGIMGALGYASNKLPCLELARRVPLRDLVALTGAGMPDEDCLAHQQALLIGSAGLLPSQRPSLPKRTTDEWTERLESLWAASGRTPVMSLNSWNFFKVRPNNYPTRRLAAASYLVMRYRWQGMLAGILRMVEEAPPQRPVALAKGLGVGAEGYWAEYFDFGYPAPARPLIGSARAGDIIVNIVLPFAYALGRRNLPALANKALDLYLSYPPLASNSVERYMSGQLALKRSLVNLARRQQGLLHIYKTLCAQDRCPECGLNQLQVGHHVQVKPVNPARPEMEIAAGGNHGGVIRAEGGVRG